MKAIVAVDKKWGIGKNNDLLFSIPEDMKFFRTTTLNSTVVMGGNTLRSFPNGNPLKNRVNIVLSKTVDRDDLIVVRSYEELFGELKKRRDEKIFIIGGASVYKEMLLYCEEILVTKIDADGNADVFFTNLDEHKDFVLVNCSEEITTQNGYKIKFTTYKNTAVKPL